MKNELKTVYTNQKSFYKKAYYTNKEFINSDNELVELITLYSYNTMVITVINNITRGYKYYVLNKVIDNNLLFSNTSLKHIKEFMYQQFNLKDKVFNDMVNYNKGNRITKNSIIKFNEYIEEGTI